MNTDDLRQAGAAPSALQPEVAPSASTVTTPLASAPAAPKLADVGAAVQAIMARAEAAENTPFARRLLVTGAAYASVGAGDVSKGVLLLLELARQTHAQGDTPTAIADFKLARRLTTEGQAPGVVDRLVSTTVAKLSAEAEFFEAQFKSRASALAPVKIAILSNSLGLPRNDDARWVAEQASARAPTDRAAPAGAQAAGETYAGKIFSELETRYGAGQVYLRPFCRRFMTTPDAAGWLAANKLTLKDHLVLIHLGLNDCASRIFMERERLAASLLSKPAQDSLVSFGQTFRVPIIDDDPEYTYTPLDEYRAKLEDCIKIARAFGAKQVFLTTTIQPPLSTEHRTPHRRWNFGRYNQTVVEIAKRFSAKLIDVDRICCEGGLTTMLQPDGMHLAAPGHAAIAANFLDQAKAYLPRA